MCSLLTAVFILMILQNSHVAGQFAVIPPKNPVIGFLGKDSVLPCQLTTSSVPEGLSITVQWVVTNPSEKIYVYNGGKKEEAQNRKYQGRMELFDTELSKGNMSLKLRNSQLSDQGKYICMITLGNWYDEVTVELKLTASGAEPTIALERFQDWGIGLTCRSHGWYPMPPVLWLNSEGENRTEKAESSNTQQKPEGTFSVSSSIAIEPGGDNEVSCKIINNVLQMESESRILISDVFYPTISSWLPPFIIILLIDLCLIAFVAYKLRKSYQNVSQSVKKKNDTKTERDHLENAIELQRMTNDSGGIEEQEKLLERIQVELDFRRTAQSYAAPFTLDPDYKHPELIISKDQKRVQLQPSTPEKPVTRSGTLMVVGKEGYDAGKQYWEVKVGDRLDWELGVLTQTARDNVKKEKFVGLLGEGCWALRSSREGFFTRQDGEKIDRSDSIPFQMIGMFLDQEARKITFYNAGVMFIIHSIPIQSNEKLYPFLSFLHAAEDDQNPLEVIQSRIPIPLQEKENISKHSFFTKKKNTQEIPKIHEERTIKEVY